MVLLQCLTSLALYYLRWNTVTLWDQGIKLPFLFWAGPPMEAQLATYTMLPSPFFECGFRHGPDISDQYGFNEEDLDDSDCD